jgi:hypothetical protein
MPETIIEMFRKLCICQKQAELLAINIVDGDLHDKIRAYIKKLQEDDLAGDHADNLRDRVVKELQEMLHNV